MGNVWGRCVEATQSAIDGLTPFYRLPGITDADWKYNWDSPAIEIEDNSEQPLKAPQIG